MSYYKKEFSAFTKRRFGRRRFPKFIILGLMMLLVLSILTSAFGGRGRYRDYHEHETEFSADYNNKPQKAEPFTNAPQPNQTTQTTPKIQADVPNEMLILSKALVRSVQNRYITQEQADAIIAQELRQMIDESEVSSNSTTTQAPQAEVRQNNLHRQPEFEYQNNRNDRHDRRHGGFFPLGFLIGGLIKLALLALFVTGLGRYLGFKPWKKAQAGSGEAREGYKGWASEEETAVEPLDDELFKEKDSVSVMPEKKEDEEEPKHESTPEPKTQKLPEEEKKNEVNNAESVKEDEK